jgi:hypothetical protein
MQEVVKSGRHFVRAIEAVIQRSHLLLHCTPGI